MDTTLDSASKDLLRRIAFLMIATVPLSNLLAFGTFTNLSFFFACLFGLFLWMSNGRFNLDVTVSVLLLTCGLVALNICFSMAFRDTPVTGWLFKDWLVFALLTVHAIALATALRMFGFHFLLRGLTVAVAFASVYAVLDFTFTNALGFRLDEHVYRYAGSTNRASIAGIVRARGPFDEPSRLAFFINVSFPLTLIGIKERIRSRSILFVYYALVVTAFTLAFSAGAFAVTAISLGLVSMQPRAGQARALVLGTVILLFLGFTLGPITELPILRVLELKLTLDADVASSADRLTRLAVTRDLLTPMFSDGSPSLFLLGYGNGYIENELNVSLGSVYFWFLVQNGVLVSLLLFGFLGVALWKSWISSPETPVGLQYSILATVCHLFFIMHFNLLFVWYPFLLISGGLTQKTAANRDGGSVKESISASGTQVT